MNAFRKISNQSEKKFRLFCATLGLACGVGLNALCPGTGLAETIWSDGGTRTGGTITNGLRINASSTNTVSGAYAISGTLPNAESYYSAELLGTGEVVIANGGAINLSGGLNAYSGTTLTVQSGGTLNVAAVADSSGCKLRFSRTGSVGTGTTIVNWAGTGLWNLNGLEDVGANGNAVFMSTVNEGSHSIFNITNGSLELQSNYSLIAFQGTTDWNVSGGTLTFGNRTNALTFGGGNWSNGTTVNGNITLTGTGTLNVRGSGNMIWGQKGNQSTLTANLNVSIDSGATLSTSRSFVKGDATTLNGTLKLNGGTFETVKPGTDAVVLSVGAGIPTTITTAGGTIRTGTDTTLTFGSALNWENASAVITKTGAGTLQLTHAETNAGSYQVNGGTLELAAGSSNAAQNVTVNAGGTLLLSDATAGLPITGELKVDGGTLSVTKTMTIKSFVATNDGTIQVANDATLNTNLTNWSFGSFTKSGAGTLLLGGSPGNGMIPVTTTLKEGTLGLYRAATMTDNKTVKMSAGTTFQYLDNSGTSYTKFELTSGKAALEVGKNVTWTSSGQMSGPDGSTFEKKGEGTLKITSSASASAIPDYVVSAGTLEFGNIQNAAKNVTVSDTSTLILNSNPLTGKLTLNNGKLIVNQDVTITTQIAGNVPTVEVAQGKTFTLISGFSNYQSGGFHKTGKGTLVIGDGSDVTGATPVTLYVDEGTFALKREETLTDNKSVQIADGATFQYLATNNCSTAASFSVQGGTGNLDVGNDLTWQSVGAISTNDGSTVQKTGTGTLKITAATTKAPNYLVSAGTLELAITNGSAAVKDLTIATNGKVNVKSNQTISGNLIMDGGALTVTNGSALSVEDVSIQKTSSISGTLNVRGSVFSAAEGQTLTAGTITLENSDAATTTLKGVSAENLNVLAGSFSPLGSGAGMLALTGSLTMAGGTDLLLKVNGATEFDRLTTEKSIHLADTTAIEVTIDSLTEPLSLGTLELMHAEDGITIGTVSARDFDWGTVFSDPSGQLSLYSNAAGTGVYLSVNPNFVPEPSSWLLGLLGLLGLGFLRRQSSRP